MALTVLVLLGALALSCHGFYVPGVAPVEFQKGAHVELRAVKMTSSMTQLPYDYYSLKFCTPPDGTRYKTENLGEVLRGDRIVNTAYDVRMSENATCKVLCNSKASPLVWSQEESLEAINKIEKEYYIHFEMDNLPAATRFSHLETKEMVYERGFRLGYMRDGDAHLFNHLHLILSYHTDDNQRMRVVGFEVEPQSIDLTDISTTESQQCSVSPNYKPQKVSSQGPTELLFTYSVTWKQSPTHWSSRWDIYLKMTDLQIHWFSIVNSLVVVFFLSGILTMIMVRTLRRDIARYNADDAFDESLEESGWKLVHGDVFRPPRFPKLFTAIVGSGTQILLMAVLTLFLAVFGMLSPASRGSLVTAGIFLYVLMALIAGYLSGRLYRTLRGQQWQSAALWTASLLPGYIGVVGIFLNIFVWSKDSSSAVPLGTIVSLIALWVFVAVPLTFVGYYFGFRKQAYEHPVRTNQIPRQVPAQVWYLHPVLSVLMAGILPFGAMFIELFFILSAIWENQYYYLFGFLFLVFLILVTSCAQISVVMTYFQLCGEDHRWWWRSLMVSGGSAVYVAAYCVFYLLTKLELTGFVPMLLYFSYTSIMVLSFWLFTATVGFYAAYWFCVKIYAAVKVD